MQKTLSLLVVAGTLSLLTPLAFAQSADSFTSVNDLFSDTPSGATTPLAAAQSGKSPAASTGNAGTTDTSANNLFALPASATAPATATSTRLPASQVPAAAPSTTLGILNTNTPVSAAATPSASASAGMYTPAPLSPLSQATQAWQQQRAASTGSGGAAGTATGTTPSSFVFTTATPSVASTPAAISSGFGAVDTSLFSAAPAASGMAPSSLGQAGSATGTMQMPTPGSAPVFDYTQPQLQAQQMSQQNLQGFVGANHMMPVAYTQAGYPLYQQQQMNALGYGQMSPQNLHGSAPKKLNTTGPASDALLALLGMSTAAAWFVRRRLCTAARA